MESAPTIATVTARGAISAIQVRSVVGVPAAVVPAAAVPAAAVPAADKKMLSILLCDA
jgi:hypothetical protein